MLRITSFETGRLLLRPLRISDLQAVNELISDRETARWTGFRPVQSLTEVEGYLRSSADGSGDSLGIALKTAPDAIIGIVTFSPDNKDTGDGNELSSMELGYFLRSDMRGNGYVPEAVEEIKRQLFLSSAIDRISIYLFPANEASRRVALKCGFHFDSLVKEAGRNGATGEIEDLEYYSLTRAEAGYELEEIQKYRETVIYGTCEDMVRARGAALAKIRALQDAAALRSFLQDNRIPGEIYRTLDSQERIKKVRMLRSFGYDIKSAAAQVVEAVVRDAAGPESIFIDKEDVSSFIRWLVSEGAQDDCSWEKIIADIKDFE